MTKSTWKQELMNIVDSPIYTDIQKINRIREYLGNYDQGRYGLCNAVVVAKNLTRWDKLKAYLCDFVKEDDGIYFTNGYVCLRFPVSTNVDAYKNDTADKEAIQKAIAPLRRYTNVSLGSNFHYVSRKDVKRFIDDQGITSFEMGGKVGYGYGLEGADGGICANPYALYQLMRLQKQDDFLYTVKGNILYFETMDGVKGCLALRRTNM